MSWVLVLGVLAAGDFTKVDEKDGVLLESREVPGSSFAEFRVTAVAAGTVEALCAKAFGTGKIEAEEPHLVKRTILSESADERVTWDEVKAPMISNRDMVVRRTRTQLPSGGCKVEFKIDSSPKAPPQDGWVRIKVLHGTFTFTPQENGKVKVEHQVHTEPGGMIAAFIVEGARKDAAISSVKRLIRGS